VRFWTKFLFDLGLLPFDEPAKKLVNQGKILGRSLFLWRNSNATKYYSYKSEFEFPEASQHLNKIHFPITLTDDGERLYEENFKLYAADKVTYKKLDLDRDIDWAFDEEGRRFLLLSSAIEKMSKRYGNVVNPDDVVSKYGADCFRLYEMFLGPVEQHKPWDTKGIDGCFRFLKRFWRLFYSEDGNWQVEDAEPANDEWKILHRTIKKVGEDIESMSFNTCVSALMICVNDLSQLDCHKRKVLEPLLLLLSPFAPFISEKLWQTLGHKGSIVRATFPAYDESLLVESSFEYPVAVNGKTRVKMNFDLNLPNEQIEKEVLSAGQLQKYFEGKTPKKVIVVKGRIINVVV
jgi:leucyl-tRNA synthetase